MITNVHMKSASAWLLVLGIFGFSFGANAQMNFTRIISYLDQGLDFSSIAFGDVDRDGDQDLFITGARGVLNSFGFYKMNYLGYHEPDRVIPPFVAVRHGSADFEDVDKDGFIDLLITGQTQEGLEIARLYKNYYARFTEVPNTPFVGVTTSAAAFSDFNNDGASDVIIAGSNAGIPVTNLYYNDGQGNFRLSVENNFIGVKGAAVAVADIDGDSDKDILITGMTSESEYVSLLYSNEGGIFNKVPDTPFVGVDDGSLDFGDIDADGDVDLILMGIRSDGTAVSELYRNNGSGVFSEEGDTPFPLLPNPQVAMEDFDHDGDLDILMRGKPYKMEMFTNDGTGVFSPHRIVAFTTTNDGSFGIADFNRDGLPDVLLTGSIGSMGRTTHYFRNTTIWNKAPIASEVQISGIPEIGGELQGSYTFFDEEGDDDQSTYRWYRSSYSSGMNKSIIFGASGTSYSPTAADQSRYISFEITPNDGITAGTAAISGLVGPILAPVPDIGLTGNGVKIENGGVGSSSENHTLFDQTVYATGISLRTFVLENSGRAELLLSSIAISGTHASEFALSAENFPVSIAPGEEFPFSVTFTPSEVGERHALLSIASNDADEEIYTFEVAGIGVNLPPEFLSEENLDFFENTEGILLDVNAHNGNGGAVDTEIFYSITGGADADLFSLNATNGLLNFTAAPDYELPKDADFDNQYLLQITADDGHSENNLSSKMITVVVRNVDEAPVAVCSEAFTVQLNSLGEATINAADVDAGSSDDSGQFDISVHPDRFTCHETGENEVTLTVTDFNGNISTCTTIITVEDDVPPEMLTQNIEVHLDSDGNASIAPTDIDNGSSDACGLYSMSVFPDSFNCADVGPNTVALKATDKNGNENSTTAVVTVVDHQPPVIEAVANIDVGSQEGECGAFLDIEAPETSENCDVKELLVSRSDARALTDLFPVGITTVTWTVEDVNGNLAEPVVQTIAVSDTQMPVIFAVDDISVENKEGECGAYVHIAVPEVLENCGLKELIGIRNDGLLLNDIFPVGTTTITWTAADINENPAEPVVQKITVSDAQAPVISDMIDISVENDAGKCGAFVQVPSPEVEENCGVKEVQGIRSDGLGLTDLFPVGTTTITWKAVDISGNPAESVVQQVAISDTELPVISDVIDISVENEEGKCGAFVQVPVPEVEENCGVKELEGIRSDGLALSALFPVGSTTITWIATDSWGNAASHVTQFITVSDKELPVVIIKDIEIILDSAGRAAITAADISNGSTDACGIKSFRISKSTFTCADVGANTITLTIVDNHDNESNAMAVVTVIDNQLPLIGEVDNLFAESQEGRCGAFLDIQPPQITDNCSSEVPIGKRSDNLLLADLFPVGETTISWNVKDANGNEATEVVQTINVRDVAVPVISEAPRVTAYAGDQCGAYVDVAVPAVSDNCETGILVATRDDGKELNAMYGLGTTRIIWNVQDKNGNSAESVVQEIEVLNDAPRNVSFTTVDVPQEIGTAITVRADFQDENAAIAIWKVYDGKSVVYTYADEDLVGNAVSHTFYDLPAGVYTIILELKDYCGLSSGENIFEYLVIYDPNGGFVTGGGWIISPENPPYEYMQHSGKANFGFNAKYKNGNNDMHEVGGNTNFQFKAGGLHFKSHSHEDMSLVISGGFKATYKGRGTINGSGDYRFMLTAIDAEQNSAYNKDLFRIKIWETESNKVVYDNNIKDGIRTEADNADPVTSIESGSIVIHKPKSNTISQQQILVVPENLSDDLLQVMQIFPNPMNSRAVVMFKLDATSSEADLRIYDMNGKEVMQLFQGRVEENRNYEVDFERGNLRTGIYICRLTTEQGQVYQKRLLLQ